MAILNKIVIAAMAFAAMSAARPLALAPRDDVTSMVTETAYTTVDIPVTVWVDGNGTPISTDAAQAANFAAKNTEVVGSSSVHASASPSVPYTTQPAAVPSTTPYTPPVVSTPTPPAVTPSTTPAQAYQAPAPSTTIPAAPPAAATNNANSGQANAVTGSSSATCEGSGNACAGDITHWDGGLGACGWNVNTESDMQIALPVGLMGSQSNGNPYCGKSLTIQNPATGQTVQATVGDKCMGCAGRSIDLTNALFNAIGGGCDGRCSNFSWWFN